MNLENSVKSVYAEISSQTPEVYLKANTAITFAAVTIETIANRRLKKYGLNHKGFIMLFMLAENGGCMTIPELTKRLHITRQAVALTSRSFEERGLVTRSGTKSDLRKLRVELTEKGIELVREIGLSDHRAQIQNVLISVASEEEAKQLTDILTKVTTKLRSLEFDS